MSTYSSANKARTLSCYVLVLWNQLLAFWNIKTAKCLQKNRKQFARRWKGSLALEARSFLDPTSILYIYYQKTKKNVQMCILKVQLLFWHDQKLRSFIQSNFLIDNHPNTAVRGIYNTGDYESFISLIFIMHVINCYLVTFHASRTDLQVGFSIHIQFFQWLQHSSHAFSDQQRETLTSENQRATH